MKNINLSYITARLSNDYGISLKGEISTDRIEIRPVELDYGIGFHIRIKQDWRNLTAEFIPDNFSLKLIEAMSIADTDKKEMFKLLLQKWSSTTNKVYMEINGSEVDSFDADANIREWKHCYIKLSKILHIPDDNLDGVKLQNDIFEIASSLLGMLLTLLPLEERSTDEASEGLPEGALTRIEVNRYERSSYNRQVCLLLHGHVCKACGFNFEERYGQIGKGFIHVHHVVPVSNLGENYKVNPATDLIPLCPNCHAMVHKRNPPYTVQELKSFIKSNLAVTTTEEM
ncbi:5-methylcytosine-specific restriction enzyme A [Terribacillus halophilus]|uniref:5-methylcytosine-specific restriction enzyme A n=1 Tax=Terribacillus halophilus TaxID=361279 RepID=A0A1G6L5R8_9BACI|nr:HNH endonuclease [Terribacillus halophilus]SDC38075.1 5-methylcytosine-specific restriction enzyme A [Terribacillus halophilus]